MSSSDVEMNTCPICQRPLGTERLEEHHLIPKTFRGKVTTRIHKICHRKIHATFTERELLNYYNTAEKILENEDMRKFAAWVSKKEPGYYDSSDETAHRKSKRRR